MPWIKPNASTRLYHYMMERKRRRRAKAMISCCGTYTITKLEMRRASEVRPFVLPAEYCTTCLHCQRDHRGITDAD
jgi:hypothetical protein